VRAAREGVQSPPLRQAMRRMAGTVCVIATGRVGNRCGLTATSVTSLSLEPPSMLVCLNRATSTYAAIVEEQCFSINVLGAHQADLARVFSSIEVARENRFASGTWRQSSHGIPQLESANASMLCNVERMLEYGSHAAIIGRVIDISLHAGASAPLLYSDGDYRQLPDQWR
jgi:flavin reductase